MSAVRSGFTLIEVLVVLLLISLAAALVAAGLFRSHETGAPELAALVGAARDAAARRAEVVHLHVASNGEWRLAGAASPQQGDFATGRLAQFQGSPFTLLVSPIGTCAFDAQSAVVPQDFALEPLTCEVRVR